MEDPCSICGLMINRKLKTRHMDMHSDVKYACNTCDKSFSRKDVLKKHEKTHGPTNFWCFPCDKTFKTGDSLREHVKITHEFVRFHCTICPKKFTSLANLKKHRITSCSRSSILHESS